MGEGKKVWHWLILVTLSLIWGTSYILMKKGLLSFSTVQIASLRIIIASFCLLPIAVKNLSCLNRDNIKSIVIIGFFGSGIPAFLFPLAQTKINSSLTGMINTLSPVFTLIIGIIFYNRKTVRSQIVGIFIGLLGALGLLYGGSLSFNFYGLFVVLATILYGVSANEAGKVEGLNGLQITALSFFIMLPFAIIIFLFTDFTAVVQTEHWLKSFACICILSVMGSAFALIIFYKLVRATSPVFASVNTYFIPIVATLWGIADGEQLSSTMIVSVIVILIGVYIINRQGFFKRIQRVT